MTVVECNVTLAEHTQYGKMSISMLNEATSRRSRPSMRIFVLIPLIKMVDSRYIQK